MEGRLGYGQAMGGRLVRNVQSKTAILIASIAGLLASGLATAQVFGERPARYGITSNFFNYDNRDDHRDFPTNGGFPGNFAGSPFFASVGAAGWLGMNPQHQAAPYPSQSYFVAIGDRLACPGRRVEVAPAGRRAPRRILCVSP